MRRTNNGCCGQGVAQNSKHEVCPPLPACQEAKSKTLFCEADQFAAADTIEETVVLADVLIQTLSEADVQLPVPARDIKQIRKNVKLTQCKALPVVGNPLLVKLFVEGFVHKNIQFVDSCSGFVRDFNVNVPFKCFQQVELANPVAFPFGEFSVKSNVLERRQLAKDGMGADRCNFGSITFEVNTEPINCKLLASAVNQWDILHNFDQWGRFNKITEKMEVILILKLTQRQQIVGGGAGAPGTAGALCEPAVTDVETMSTIQNEETPLNVWEKFKNITGQ
ncbi:CsxC family protein [Cytobacillus sp.]|uniref:CsxC family protein n=1 Tax=Cytobacillus sp. TaxID=2675269 RepID=UPI0028BDF00C|nr:hypothetical protein [Cytobacillus sp.]